MNSFNKEPKAIIEDGKVLNHAQLVRYWADRNFKRDRLRRGMFNDLRDAKGKQPEINPVFRPRPVNQELDDLKGQVNFLQNRINGHLDTGKKNVKPVTSIPPQYKDEVK